jgi:protein involved in polysaccharide export with SLBB domain
MKPFRILPGLALLLALSSPLASQIPDQDLGFGSSLTRADLEQLLLEYGEALMSSAYSDQVKERVRANSLRIQERLEYGDFRVGDRIVIRIRNEPDIPDTVVVQPGPQVTLGLLGEVPLRGILRSELTDHLYATVGRLIRDPVIEATPLIRLSVQGAVTQPGFYQVPADVLLSDAIMVAGGPIPTANLEGLQVQRGNEDLLAQDETQAALIQGMTLDQLSLRAGDQLSVPANPEGGIWGRIGQITLVTVPVIAILQLLRQN